MSEGREVLIEYVVLGNFARLTAVDVTTGVEATAQGPAHALRADLEALAMGKLKRALAAVDKDARPGGPGKLV